MEREELERLNDLMTYRGPNDAGVEIWDAGEGWTLGLAQRRLAILDLSPRGHQPMTAADGRVTIVYNGEIYNYRELRSELPDYPFQSTCDTEVILAAYEKWGIECISRFNGMFAFALYDRDQKTLYLVRDRLGQKPLYYWKQEQGGILFASDLKVILEAPGFPTRLRRDVLGRYLCQGYLNAPDTVLEGVYKLCPGSVLAVHGGAMETTKYWDVAETYRRMQEMPVTDYEEAKTTLKGLMQQAVKRRLVADVPLGCFLSGGYDSSLIAALAQEQLGEMPLKTFSVGFADPAYNEAGYARQVAEHLGTDHTEVVISEKDMFDLVASIPTYFDEPFADSSQIPTMLVSQIAKKDVTVALSGDAGDELFCGYNVYDKIAQAQKLDRLGAVAHVIGMLPTGIGRLEDRYPFRIRTIAKNRDPRTKTQFGEGSYGAAARALAGWREGDLPVSYPIELSYPTDNWQERRMLLDLDTYLPGDILNKVDRASMKYSLENRCPLLDVTVVEYAFRIDHEFKYRDGVKKYILRDIAWEYLPRELMDRPKKGFAVPLDKWLRGPLQEELLSYADRDRIRRQGLFDAEAVSSLTARFLAEGDAGHGSGRNFSKLLWSYFVFQQWYAAWIGN